MRWCKRGLCGAFNCAMCAEWSSIFFQHANVRFFFFCVVLWRPLHVATMASSARPGASSDPFANVFDADLCGETTDLAPLSPAAGATPCGLVRSSDVWAAWLIGVHEAEKPAPDSAPASVCHPVVYRARKALIEKLRQGDAKAWLMATPAHAGDLRQYVRNVAAATAGTAARDQFTGCLQMATIADNVEAMRVIHEETGADLLDDRAALFVLAADNVSVAALAYLLRLAAAANMSPPATLLRHVTHSMMSYASAGYDFCEPGFDDCWTCVVMLAATTSAECQKACREELVRAGAADMAGCMNYYLRKRALFQC